MIYLIENKNSDSNHFRNISYYKKYGYTYHALPQLESVIKGKAIPGGLPLVEAMFMAEVKNMFLTAGHDYDKTRAPLSLRISTGDESYTTMNGKDVTTISAESCRYDVCMIVEDSFQCDSRDVAVKTVSGGKYATLLIPHTAQAVQSAWGMVPALCEKGYALDFSRPILERYAKRLVDQHFCELCVPVM